MTGTRCCSAPRQKVVLDAAAHEVVEHLVASRRGADMRVEAASSSMSSTSKLLTPQWRIFPSRCSASNASQRFVERNAAPPVQQIQIEPVGFQTPKARFARCDRAPPGRVLRQDLAHEEDLARGDRRAPRQPASRRRRRRTFLPCRPPSCRDRRPDAARQSRRRACAACRPCSTCRCRARGCVSPLGSAIVRMPAIFLYNPPYEDSPADASFSRVWRP